MTCRSSAGLVRRPFDIVLTLDRSLTMNETTATGETKWTAVTGGLRQFCTDPASEGLGMAVGFFAIFDQPNHVSCDVSTYENLPVKMGTLGVQATVIAAATDAVQFETSASAAKTPMRVALQGAIAYARTWATQHASDDVTVALATDGTPNVCEGTWENVVAAAAEGVGGNPSIRTHVLAILEAPNAPSGDGRGPAPNAHLQNLNAVAAAGRTGTAFVIDTGAAGTQDRFASALNAIRQSRGRTCQFMLPSVAGASGELGRSIIRIQDVLVPRKTAYPECGTSDGFFYDDESLPASVTLCESTCARLAAVESTAELAWDCDGLPPDSPPSIILGEAGARGVSPGDGALECLLQGQSCASVAECCSSACCSAVCAASACP